MGEHLRATGIPTGGPAAMQKQDRSRFLEALDSAIHAAIRDVSAPPPRKWVSFE